MRKFYWGVQAETRARTCEINVRARAGALDAGVVLVSLGTVLLYRLASQNAYIIYLANICDFDP